MNAPDEPGNGGTGAGPDDHWGDDDGPFFAWLPPEDRLWVHPSEAARAAGPGSGPLRVRHRVPTALTSTWVVAVIAGLIGALAATGVGVASGLWPHDTTVLRPVVESTSAVSLADIGAAPVNWTSVVDSVEPSVVAVSVQGAAGLVEGSGLVVMAAGGRAYVVTDRSLLAADMAAGYVGHIEVTFLSGQLDVAHLIGQDPLSGLAVLATGEPSGLVAADLGTVDGLEPAAPVVAVGCREVQAVSIGSVSGLDRSLELSDGSDLDDLLALTMPQLGSGADGGPVLDQFGRVVGVIVGVQPADEADEQYTFLVPADEVTRVAREMIEGQRVTHPWAGVSELSDVPSALAHALGVAGGVAVGNVEPGGPAAAAGLRADDVVVTLAGKPVDSAGALLAALDNATPGRAVAIGYDRGGRVYQAEVTIGEEPEDG